MDTRFSRREKQRNRASTSTQSSTKAKSKHREQRYRTAWEDIQEFKGWLGPASNPLKARCNVCDTEFKSELGVVKNHSKGQRHIIALLIPPSSKMVHKISQQSDPIMKAKIKLGGYVAEQNIASRSIDHVDYPLENTIPVTEIATNRSIKGTKIATLYRKLALISFG